MLLSCHKDPAVNPIPTDSCPDIGYKGLPGVEVDYHCRFSYGTPTPNPLDKDEFAYVYADSVQMGDSMYPHYQLRVYNLTTGENRELIHDINIDGSGGMSWSKKGWILFITGWGEINKIKSDGTELTRLGNLSGFQPSWSPDGDKFYYYTYAGGDGGYVADENGNILIKTFASGYQLQWADENRVRITDMDSSKGWGLGLFDFNTNQFARQCSIPQEQFNMENYQWIDDHTVVWVPESGGHIYIRDLKSDKTITLRNTCPDYNYFRITISPDKKYIYCSRGYLYTFANGRYGRGISEIVRINLSTGELQRINLEL
jgi:hypothetical protein